jgi:caffeoyl-CoA O-methyltransferase
MELMDFSREIREYIEAHSTPEDAVLASLNRYTNLKVIHPRMLSGQVQGKFLEFISRMISPGRILEIGTYTGYSAICLARGLKPDGRLFTIEINDEFEPVSSEYFSKSGLSDRIIQLTGDAIEIVPGLEETFDLVFIDAEKEQYCDYFELVFPKVRPGGFILADNTLWDGKVIQTDEQNDPATLAIREFNRMVNADLRVDNIILPVRDGISIIRKKPEVQG